MDPNLDSLKNTNKELVFEIHSLQIQLLCIGIPSGEYIIQSVCLGLFICQKIIEQHGGTIDVKSTPGQGSLFTVKIPKSAEGQGR